MREISFLLIQNITGGVCTISAARNITRNDLNEPCCEALNLVSALYMVIVRENEISTMHFLKDHYLQTLVGFFNTYC